jgi:RimJ/RimL family protein N-acetyltransferase
VCPPPLREAAPDDVGFLHRLLTAPEVRRYLCDDAVLPRERVEAILSESLALRDRGLGLWVFGEPPFGCVGLLPVSGPAAAAFPAFAGDVELLVALDPRLWGRGLARGAAAAVLRHDRARLGLPRVAAFVDAPNAASHHLMVRLGFRPVGTAAGPRLPLRAYALEAAEAAP